MKELTGIYHCYGDFKNKLNEPTKGIPSILRKYIRKIEKEGSGIGLHVIPMFLVYSNHSSEARRKAADLLHDLTGQGVLFNKRGSFITVDVSLVDQKKLGCTEQMYYYLVYKK